MRAFTSARYTVDIGHHSYPMDKYRLVPERLLAEETLTPDNLLEPEAATLDDVLRVHTPEYVHAFVSGTLERKAMLRIGLPWSAELVRRAFAVIGGTIGAARRALADGVAANLAGGTHHAFADHGEGYCIFNDMVVAMRRLRADNVARRFLVIDLDVHQGNGSAALCQHDAEVFTFSMHGETNYPARKEKSSWDIALPEGTGDEEYLARLFQALPRLLECFSPELIFYQAGVDVLAGDRFGKLQLTMAGVRERDSLVSDFARRTGLPLVITLGGGYARDMQQIVEAHCQTVRVAKSRG
ncbi:MAG TPA: histone deacetylase [Methylomirabilota bacterium]|jgi:acetoin utilization deacetylase AcuC-like enzyme|nr:histone deacetylase [Methylomirabilota bacterium]